MQRLLLTTTPKWHLNPISIQGGKPQDNKLGKAAAEGDISVN
jgi:hypothetical protein